MLRLGGLTVKILASIFVLRGVTATFPILEILNTFCISLICGLLRIPLLLYS